MAHPSSLPRLASSDGEIASCYACMAELRPHLIKEDFIQLVRQMQEEGYQLLFLEHRGEIVATAGFRLFTNLYKGKCLYVDDLVTASAHRSKGHGKTLLDWLYEHAIEQNCHVLHLDSGTQRHRAHAFYFRQKMAITSFHFAREIPTKSGH